MHAFTNKFLNIFARAAWATHEVAANYTAVSVAAYACCCKMCVSGHALKHGDDQQSEYLQPFDMTCVIKTTSQLVQRLAFSQCLGLHVLLLVLAAAGTV